MDFLKFSNVFCQSFSAKISIWPWLLASARVCVSQDALIYFIFVISKSFHACSKIKLVMVKPIWWWDDLTRCEFIFFLDRVLLHWHKMPWYDLMGKSDLFWGGIYQDNWGGMRCVKTFGNFTLLLVLERPSEERFLFSASRFFFSLIIRAAANAMILNLFPQSF